MSDISFAFVYVSGTLDREMAPSWKKVVARRHLVCGNCASWVHYETSGCEKKWADTRAEGFEFTCKGCTEVAVLDKEVSGLKQMMEDLKETVAGLQLDDKGAETGSRVTTTGVSQDREETAGNSSTGDTDTGMEDEEQGRTEERTEICAGTTTGVSQDREETAGSSRTEDPDTVIEDEGEGGTEERTEICAGTPLMATNGYTKNQDSPIGKEIDLQQWDTLIYKGAHAENKHWSLVQDRTGQVGYAPAGFLVVILDTTTEEQESDATKKGQENSTAENRIGQEGERRKSYSAAVKDGVKRNTTIYVGDSIIRKTDTRLSKGEDVVVCFPGARIEHVTERVEKIVGRGKGGTILVHVGTNNTDKEGTTAIVEKYRKLLKKTKQARLGQIILSGILPVCGNRIQGYRNSKRMAVNGMVERLCQEEDVGYVDMWDSFVGNEELYFRDGLHLSGKGAAVLAEGLSGAVASGLGKVRYLN